jgi:hypothetical protein
MMSLITRKPRRVFRCDYICDECPNEWTDEALVIATGFCPCCDKPVEPYHTVELWDERAMFDLGDEIDPDGLDKALAAMEEANKAMEECLQELKSFRTRRGL